MSSQQQQQTSQFYQHHHSNQNQYHQGGQQSQRSQQHQHQHFGINEHQQHHRRSGAEVTPSNKSYVQNQMKRANDIENQLGTLTGGGGKTGGNNRASVPSSTEELASKLRMQLCELLSDILLTEPSFALKNDCIGRLWRSCFYTPIGQFRSRISKERKKRTSIDRGSQLQQQQGKVARLEKQLYHFLSEAVTLYDYLVSQYQLKLLRPSDLSISGSSQQQSQHSQKSSRSRTGGAGDVSSDVDKSLVPGLFRMYIHLGDLHRYSTAYGKAQSCYLKAAQLAPGHGNPYNQLAVVAQLKDTAAPLNCVALYWYARSLLTTCDSFEISKANLTRLFQSNREWLQQQQEQQQQDNLTITSDNTDNSTTRAQKTAASRHFLSRFVDLHYSLFQTDTDPNVILEGKTIQSLFVKSFMSLLETSAFGDSLICKMVAIHAFSECYPKKAALNPASSKKKKKTNHRDKNNDEKDDESGKLEKQRARDMALTARVVTLTFGSCIAERVGKEKKHSHRLLLPLLLLCEFIEHHQMEAAILDDSASTSDSNGILLEITRNFGRNMVNVMNRLHPLRLQLVTTSGPSALSLKEYKNLLGFSPFAFLDEGNNSLQDGFVQSEKAVDVLDLKRSSMSISGSTQESTTASVTNSSGNSPEENKIKVARLLAFGQRLAESNSTELGRHITYTSKEGGIYEWKEDKDTKDTKANQTRQPSALVTGNGTSTAASESEVVLPEDDGGDVLVYSVPEGGSSALLMPGDLLNQQQKKQNRQRQPAKQSPFSKKTSIIPEARSTPVKELTNAAVTSGIEDSNMSEAEGLAMDTTTANVPVKPNIMETERMPPPSLPPPSLPLPPLQPSPLPPPSLLPLAGLPTVSTNAPEKMDIELTPKKTSPLAKTLPPPPGFGPSPGAASTNPTVGVSVSSTGAGIRDNVPSPRQHILSPQLPLQSPQQPVLQSPQQLQPPLQSPQQLQPRLHSPQQLQPPLHSPQQLQHPQPMQAPPQPPSLPGVKATMAGFHHSAQYPANPPPPTAYLPPQQHFLLPGQATPADHNVFGDLPLFGGPTPLETANPFAPGTIAPLPGATTAGNIGSNNYNNNKGLEVGGFSLQQLQQQQQQQHHHHHQLLQQQQQQQQQQELQQHHQISVSTFQGQPITAAGISALSGTIGVGGSVSGIVGGVGAEGISGAIGGLVGVAAPPRSFAETSLLGSGLLNSLWMDDATAAKNNTSAETKNPFTMQ